MFCVSALVNNTSKTCWHKEVTDYNFVFTCIVLRLRLEIPKFVSNGDSPTVYMLTAFWLARFEEFCIFCHCSANEKSALIGSGTCRKKNTM